MRQSMPDLSFVRSAVARIPRETNLIEENSAAILVLRLESA